MGLDNLTKYTGKKNNIEQGETVHSGTHARQYDGYFEEQLNIPMSRRTKKTVEQTLGINLEKSPLQCEIARIIHNKDNLVAVNRYKWENLPFGSLTSQKLERLLYFRYKLIAFKLPDTDQILITPYAGAGLGFYGECNYATPIPIATTSDGIYESGWDISKEDWAKQKEFLGNLKLKLIYNEDQLNSIDESEYGLCAVPLFDYTTGLGNTSIPRARDADQLIDVEAKFIPYVDTAAINATGIRALLCKGSADSAMRNAESANNALKNAALTGKGIIPVLTGVSTEELSNGSVGKTSEFMQGMQCIDNFRLSRLGVSNGGLFEKNSHMLESEQAINASSDKSILYDGLDNRTNFTKLCSKLFKKQFTVKINENMLPEEKEEDEEMVGRKPLEDSEKSTEYEE